MGPERISIAFRDAAVMISRYIAGKVREQVRSSAFIIIYLFLFQILILGSPAGITLRIIGGVLLVIAGLTLFMEGLVLGLMPLGESVGLHLPRRSRLWQLITFGLVIGFVSTLAEPAISSLRSAGSTVTAWDAPLLYMLLEVYPGALIAAIGAGVGLAVATSLLRYHFGISVKPFILITLPLILLFTILLSFNESLRSIIGLAWDTGAVTTGPVTVPLVLALGMGVSRASGKHEGKTGGFGSIALASLFPVLAVMCLSSVMYMAAPQPTREADFFSLENRGTALRLFSSEQELISHAFTRGSEEGRRSLYADEQAYLKALKTLVEDETLLAGMDMNTWISTRASDFEIQYIHETGGTYSPAVYQVPLPQVMREESSSSLRAVVPLAGLLLIVLTAVLRDRLRYRDEFLLGITLTLLGMMLLTAGIRLGLLPLGDTVGRQLPRIYQAEMIEETVIIENFDASLVYEGIGTDGKRYHFFYLQDGTSTRKAEFIPDNLHREKGHYTYTLQKPPLFGSGLSLAGMLFVLFFAFGLGYGSTLAEPALNALGKSVEEITVGTVRARGVVRAVSVGVGAGLVAGVLRILYEIPMMWMLLPVYLLLIPLTIWSDTEFAGISWDSGGVTTGPITVPLVLAMGLGIGGAMQLIDGFGILAMASVYPILTVQLYGFTVRMRQRRTIKFAEQEGSDE